MLAAVQPEGKVIVMSPETDEVEPNSKFARTNPTAPNVVCSVTHVVALPLAMLVKVGV